MSNVSPSSQKVDDFLSKISQLSQQRLRESEITKRCLQSDISSSRGSSPNDYSAITRYHGFEVSQLTFNRSGRDTLPSDSIRSPPALPSRQKPAFEARISDGFPQRNEPGSKERHISSKMGLLSSYHVHPPLPSRPSSVGVPRTINKRSKPENLRNPDTLKAMGKPFKPAVLSSSQKMSLNEPNGDSFSPQIPQRLSLQTQAFAGLLRPVANEDTSIRTIPSQHISQKVIIPNYVASPNNQMSTGGQPAKIASFSDLEAKIRARAGARDEMTEKPNPSSDGKEKLDEKFPIPSSKPSWAPTLKPVTPVKPAKPTLRSFENQNTELSKDQIERLSPTKTKQGEVSKQDFNTEKSPASASEKPGPNLNDLAKQALRPMKPAKPQALNHEPNVLFARGNLRKLQPKQPEPVPVPEALRKIVNLTNGSASPSDMTQSKGERKSSAFPRATQSKKSDNDELGAPNSNKPNSETSEKNSINAAPAPSSAISGSEPKKTDFYAHLASIIRSSTESSMMRPSNVKPVPSGELKRASTVPEPIKSESKLTHPNKSRAKGPKRRLPKSGSTMQSKASQKNQTSHIKSVISKNTQNINMEIRSLAYNNIFLQGKCHEIKTSGKLETDANPTEYLFIRKSRKAPPPIARKPNFIVTPSRKVSCELFI